MKKIILIFAVLGILSLLAKQPVLADIFSDSNFTQPTHNFSAGQMVYVKVESLVNGDREKSLRILDAEKREIQRLDLNRQDNIFTASFAAPNTSGIYYVDIKIRDAGGSVYSSQENISVDESSCSCQSVSSESVAVAETGVEEEVQPTPTLKVEEKVIEENFFSQFLDALFSFLRKIFRFNFGT